MVGATHGMVTLLENSADETLSPVIRNSFIFPDLHEQLMQRRYKLSWTQLDHFSHNPISPRGLVVLQLLNRFLHPQRSGGGPSESSRCSPIGPIQCSLLCGGRWFNRCLKYSAHHDFTSSRSFRGVPSSPLTDGVPAVHRLDNCLTS